MNYFLINTKSNKGLRNKKITKYINKLEKKEPCVKLDFNEANGKERALLEPLTVDDKVFICGGDGTISTFFNAIKDISFNTRMFVFKSGTGNDFARDYKRNPFEITSFIPSLHIIKSEKSRIALVNGCGMGVDAEVCRQKEFYDKSNHKKSYTAICLEVFKHYKPYSLDVVIDGKKLHYDNVWFFVTNHGKYFGGGKKVCPKAKRDDGLLDICIAHDYKYPFVLLIFPFLIFGKHLIFKKHIAYFQCKHVEASTSDNVYFQVDGEIKEDIKHIEIDAK